MGEQNFIGFLPHLKALRHCGVSRPVKYKESSIEKASTATQDTATLPVEGVDYQRQLSNTVVFGTTIGYQSKNFYFLTIDRDWKEI